MSITGMRVTVHVNGDGFATRSGIVTSLGTKLVSMTREGFALYVPGESVWSGRGLPRRYAPAEYEVYTWADGPVTTVPQPDKDGRMWLVGVCVIAFPVRMAKT